MDGGIVPQAPTAEAIADSGPAGDANSGLAFGARACVEATPLGGGWQKCANGQVHRAAVAGQCASSVPRAEGLSPSQLAANPAGLTCQNDSDCTQQAYGHCEVLPGFGGSACVYGCVTDAECRAGSICVCGDPVGTCLSSQCTTDADCKLGLMCTSFRIGSACELLPARCDAG